MDARLSRRRLVLSAAATAAAAPFGGLPGITPALDRPPAEGVAFHRVHVPLAACQPSREYTQQTPPFV